MKTIKFILATIALCISLTGSAQNMLTTNIEHPTISGIKVIYHSVPQATTGTIMAIPQATISLKPAADAVKLYFKILDKVTNTVIYDVNYLLSSSPVTGANGKKLFENISGIIYISNGTTIPLKPCIYQLQTENNQGVKSTIYSTIQ